MSIHSNWYRTGKVNVEHDSQIVTGVNTAWTATVKKGDIFLLPPDGPLYEIDEVIGNMELKLRTPYQGSTDTDLDYAIIRNFTSGLTAAVAAKMLKLLERWHVREDEWVNWHGGTADGGPNGDGKYPFTTATGTTVLISSPAKLQSIVDAGEIGEETFVLKAGDTVPGDMTFEGNCHFTGQALFNNFWTPGISRKNFVINGNFDFWNLNFPFTGSVVEYTARRWRKSVTANVDRSTTTASITDRYSLRVYGNAEFIAIGQPIESTFARMLAGRDVSLSFACRRNSSAHGTPYIILRIPHAPDDYSTFSEYYASFTIGPQNEFDWLYFSLPSLSTDVINGLDLIFVFTLGDAANIDYRLNQVQLEFGPGFSPFERKPPAEERMLCERYQQFDIPVSASGYAGAAADDMAALCPITWPYMRDWPTVTPMIYGGTNIPASPSLEIHGAWENGGHFSIESEAAGPINWWGHVDLDAEIY